MSISLNFFPMVYSVCGLLVWGLLIVFSLFRSFCVDFVVQGFVRTVMGVLPVVKRSGGCLGAWDR